jgi:hypothetical protein
MMAASKIIIKHFFRPENKISRQLPVYYPPQTSERAIEDIVMSPVSNDNRDDKLDLNGYLISHPSSTFLVKISGEPSAHLGLSPGDLLIVDQTLEVLDGSMVVGAMNESFFVSFIKIKNKQLYLASEQLHEPDIRIVPELKCSIWGVVSYTIHKPVIKPATYSKKKIHNTMSVVEKIEDHETVTQQHMAS